MTDRLKASEWSVLDATMATIREMTAKYHYAGRGSNTATYRHGLYRRADWRCFGVAHWIPPTRRAAEATWTPWQEVLALHRLVCHPAAPRNAASFLIGGSIRAIRQDAGYTCLVTYADEAQGHTGQIYRATNWQYLGLTAPEPVFHDSEGRMISRKAGGNTRMHSEMLDLGYVIAHRSRKHKFRMVLA